jgi:predicted phage-related endonuclease
MKIGGWLALASVGVCAALSSSEAVRADYYAPRNSARARAEIHNNWAEIRKDRAELRRDIDEYYESRADLNRAIRREAPRAVIAERRAEVRQDLREVTESQRELRQDYQELNEDLRKYGWYRHSDGRWYRYPAYGYGGWNRDNRWDRDRHDWWPWNNWWR